RDCLPVHICLQVCAGTASPSTSASRSAPGLSPRPHPSSQRQGPPPCRPFEQCHLRLLPHHKRRFVFTRPEDLPRARAVWGITAQTNLRKSMWEVRDKAMKTTDNRDPMAWVDYGPVWRRRDYWESLCERWAAGLWQQRSQAAIRNRATQPKKNVHTSGSVSYATHSQKLHHDLERAPTFRELFDRTHKRKGTDDYVTESARTIAETYDRTMAERYAEGTP
ncbi:hypothetical protein Taro_041875, partial [Colocasia esculenta]|nr:hypothetical protein [Colocasia esculenta]